MLIVVSITRVAVKTLTDKRRNHICSLYFFLNTLNSFRDQHNGSMSEILLSDKRPTPWIQVSEILSSLLCPLDSGKGLDKLLIYHLFLHVRAQFVFVQAYAALEVWKTNWGLFIMSNSFVLLFCLSLICFIKLKNKKKIIACINMNNLFNILTLVIKINNYISYIATNHGDSIFYIVVFRKPRHIVYTSIIYTP